MKTMMVALSVVVLFCGMGCSRQMRSESVEQKLGESPVVYGSSYGEKESGNWANDGESSLKVVWHPSGTLITADESSEVYVVEAALKHLVKDEDVFMAHGWDWDQVVSVSAEEIACYADGVEIDWAPQRIFFSVVGDDSLYLTERQSDESDSCLVYPLASTLAAQSWGAVFNELQAFSEEEAEQEFFSKCGDGVVLFIRAGSIVKPLFAVDGFGAGVVFIADGDGVLRPFENYDVFKVMGYESVPMMTTISEEDFYASFIKFGDVISEEAVETCAAVEGVYEEPEGTIGGEEEDEPINDIDTDEECEGGIGGGDSSDVEASEEYDVALREPSACLPVGRGDIAEALFDDDQVGTLGNAVKCEFSCPAGMTAWIWYGEEGEQFSDGTLLWQSSEEEICQRGFPWVDFNCAKSDWSQFDQSLAEIKCDHSFVRHGGVIDFGGEGELFFNDFVCYEWNPSVAKPCGKWCVALSAYYLYRADVAVVLADLPGASLDFATAKQVWISADEYYHFSFENAEAGTYQLQYFTLNEEPAYFGVSPLFVGAGKYHKCAGGECWVEFVVGASGDISPSE